MFRSSLFYCNNNFNNIKMQRLTIRLVTFLLLTLSCFVQAGTVLQQRKNQTNPNPRGSVLRKRKNQITHANMKNQDITQHNLCIPTVKKPISLPPPQANNAKNLQGRFLQTLPVVNYKISADFPQSTTLNVELNVLRNLFQISAKYYQKTIKVRQRAPGTTKYPTSAGTKCLDVTVNSIYINQGYDPTLVDTKILVAIFDQNSNTIAYAVSCYQQRYSMYGGISFNARNFETDLSKPDVIQESIMTIMHELGHVLGINAYDMYYNYYVSPTSTTKLTNTQTLSRITLTSGNIYQLITPNAKTFAKQYFGCTDGTTGIALTPDGGSIGSHVNQFVYQNEMMNPYSWRRQSRLGRVTMEILWATGWYVEVDRTLVNDFTFGQGDGCNFAKSTVKVASEYCATVGEVRCDHDYVFGGNCSSITSIPAERSTASKMCQVPSDRGFSESFDTFSAQSRCLEFSSGGIACLVAKCTDQNNIVVSYNGQNKTCTKGGATTISFTGIGTLKCPDYPRFCAVQTCQNWCNSVGVCIGGECFLEDCSLISNCNLCKLDQNKQFTCMECNAPATLTGNTCLTSACSVKCTNCGDTACTACVGDWVPSGVNCIAPTVCSVTNCNTCGMVNDKWQCITCATGYGLSSTGTCVKACNINYCLTCDAKNKCTLCAVGYKTASNKTRCVPI